MMRRLNKISLPFIVFLIILFFYGCFSSPSKRYFQIQIESSEVNAGKRIKKTIFLKDIKVNDFYDDYRLVYRKSQYELNYYSYEFWAIKPGKLIKKAILDYQRSNEYYKLIGDLSDQKPDYYIQAALNSIEEIDNHSHWYGRLSMTFSLYSFKSGKKLLDYNFDKRERFPEMKIEHFPKIISKILRDNIDILMNKVKNMEE